VSEYLDTLGLVQSYFFKFFEKKLKKNREKKVYWCSDAPEDQAICLLEGLLGNPDVPLSLTHDEDLKGDPILCRDDSNSNVGNVLSRTMESSLSRLSRDMVELSQDLKHHAQLGHNVTIIHVCDCPGTFREHVPINGV
jgi:hypothetical protein